MKRLAYLLLLLVPLSGCAMFGDTKPILKEPPSLCKVTDVKTGVVTVNQLCAAAAESLAQANALLASIDRTVLGHLTNKIWTLDQARPVYVQTGKYGEDVDKAQAAFNALDFSRAFDQAEVVKRLLTELHKQVAAHARKAEIIVNEWLMA